jgi:hypothetical protein
VALEDRVQLAPGELHALEQDLERAVLLRPVARHAFQRALQVVGDGHKIAQHGRGGIAHRLLALALAAAALVLRFGQGPQQLIAKLGDLGREPCGPRRLVLFRFGRFRLSDLLGCDFLAPFGARRPITLAV